MRFLLLILTLVFLLDCCSLPFDKHLDEKFKNPTSFPFVGYSKVELYTLDKSDNRVQLGESINGSKFEQYPGLNAGEFFIDTFASPLTDHITMLQLDSIGIVELQGIFSESPCVDSYVLDKACFPLYDRVLLFKDIRGKCVGQIHISASCEMTALYPVSTRMCNRDNTINFKRLDSLLSLTYPK